MISKKIKTLMAMISILGTSTFLNVAMLSQNSTSVSSSAATASAHYIEPLDAATLIDIKTLYKQLIDAENKKEFEIVKRMVWKSPSALFVAKTATPAEGNWAGFWGYDVVIQHLHDVIDSGPFRIDPDYPRVKVVGLTHDVAETYAPVQITVAYAGQTPVPKPFLMIIDWIKTPEGWKIASDIAIPIPSSPLQSK